MDQKLTVLTIGYKKDEDVIPIQESFFIKFWSDCKYARVFSLDGIAHFAGFESVSTNDDSSFSARLKKGLENIHTDYVLLLLGDYWLNDKPNSAFLDKCCEFMDSFEVDFLQLGTQMESKLRGKKIKNLPFSKLSPKKHYRINLQQAIWRKSSLVNIVEISKINSTWDFEIFFIDNPEGKLLSRSYNAYFSNKYTFPIVNGMEKGKISYPAIKLLDAHHIPYPPNREIETKKEYRRKHRFDYFHSIMPNSFRKIIKQIFTRSGKKFLSKG